MVSSREVWETESRQVLCKTEYGGVGEIQTAKGTGECKVVYGGKYVRNTAQREEQKVI